MFCAPCEAHKHCVQIGHRSKLTPQSLSLLKTGNKDGIYGPVGPPPKLRQISGLSVRRPLGRLLELVELRAQI